MGENKLDVYRNLYLETPFEDCVNVELVLRRVEKADAGDQEYSLEEWAFVISDEAWDLGQLLCRKRDGKATDLDVRIALVKLAALCQARGEANDRDIAAAER